MCILVARGKRWDVDRFVAKTSLPLMSVHRRGEPMFPRHKPKGRKHKTSGISVDVSNASWNGIRAQVRDAERFLRVHRRELARLARQRGVEEFDPSFPAFCRIGWKTGRSRVAVQFEEFPASLVRAAGSLGIGFDLAIYG